MEERLLLDRITLHSADVPPGNVELTAAIKAHFADTRLTVGNGATVSAGEAAHAIAVKFLNQVGIGLSDAGIEDVAEGGHRIILCLIGGRAEG
jgi:hypothetical protein